MRSIFHPELEHSLVKQQIVIDGERAKHLIKSVRLNLNERVLLLDGKGRKGLSLVTQIGRHDLTLTIESIECNQNAGKIDLAICCSKKDAMEEIVRNSVELGIVRLIPIISTYAQRDFCWNSRLDRIAESALIQSNNPYFPEFCSTQTWDELLETITTYDQVFYFSSQSTGTVPQKMATRCLMIIGPEGGLSQEEERQLSQISNLHLLQLDTPIMRAATAQVAAVGWLKSLGF